MTRSDDESTVAWTADAFWEPGVLASSPRDFDACTGFGPLTNGDPEHGVLNERELYQITNKGLRM